MEPKRFSRQLLAALILAMSLGVFVAVHFTTRQGAFEGAELQRPGDERSAPNLQPSADKVTDPASLEQSQSLALDLSQRTEADSKRLEILVLDPDSAPVPDATILLFHADEVLARGRTDEHGLTQFPAREGAGEYVLAASGWQLTRGAVELSLGRKTINLVEGAIVAGTVLVDGAPPTPPMELGWNSNDRKTGVLAQLPSPVAQALYTSTANRAQGLTRTKPDGTFAFHGLAVDAAGTIRWDAPCFPEGANMENDDREFVVAAPRRDLMLRLIAGVQLRMRVVDSNGEPLPRALIGLSFQRDDANSDRSSMSAGASSDGRFVYAFLPDAFDKLEVRVSASQRAGARIYNFVPPAHLRGVWDLGDLAIGATREITVIARDAQGQPIKDAQAAPASATVGPSSHRTDADGRVSIAIDAEETSIGVVALGYLRAIAAVAPDATEVAVTLERACMLEFEIPGFSGDIKDLVLELSGATPMFVGELTDPAGTLRVEGGGWASHRSGGTSRFESRFLKVATWKVACLTPNQAIHVKLRGGSKELCAVEVAPLAEGEHRKVELHVDELAKKLRVRVLMASGAPLPDANVGVFVRVGNSTSYDTRSVDAQGEVELDGLFGDQCMLFADAKGFARAFATLRPIPDRTFEFVLEPARSVEIELVRPDGSLFLDDAQVFQESNGPQSERAVALGQGRYRLDDLPSGEVRIELRGGLIGNLSRLIDGSVPFTRIAIGESTFVSVSMTGATVSEVADWSVGIADSGSARDVTRASFAIGKAGAALAGIKNLPPGKYDVWLEKRADSAVDAWTRVGTPTSVLIDAEHPSVSVALRPPG